MGMNDIHFFFFDDLFQNEIGTEHLKYISLVQRCLIMTNANLCQFLFEYAAVGSNDDIIALFFQLLGKLNHMGFCAADLQTHQNHQNLIFFHVSPSHHSPMLVTLITGFAYFVTVFISEFVFSSTIPSTK